MQGHTSRASGNIRFVEQAKMDCEICPAPTLRQAECECVKRRDLNEAIHEEVCWKPQRRRPAPTTLDQESTSLMGRTHNPWL